MIVEEPGTSLRSLSLRQAKVLREMLKLGSFTAEQIAAVTGEGERYIQNLICDPSAILKRRNLLVPVENVKQRRVGAPAKVWAIDPEKQEEIIERLEPYFETFEAEHVAEMQDEKKASVDESVYQFVCNPSPAPNESNAKVYSATISIQRRGEHVELCGPVVDTHQEVVYPEQNAILVDPMKIANGLAALCQTRATSGQNVTAVVNFRGGMVHFVFLRKGAPQSFFTMKLQADSNPWDNKAISLSLHSKYLFLNHLKNAIQMYERSYEGERVDEVLISGNLRSPSGVCRIISAMLRIRCGFLDPTEALAFSSECMERPHSRQLIMNFVPEIGYAFSKWLIESQTDPAPVYSKKRQTHSHSSPAGTFTNDP